MDKKIKKSVAILLAHMVKVTHRDIKKKIPIFCSLMGQNFQCDKVEAAAFLKEAVENNYNLDEHVEIINEALKHDQLSKMHILEQLNRMICLDDISEEDYTIFDNIKKKLFPDID